MKKVLLFLGVIGLVVFASCKRDDNPSAEGSMSFSVAFEEPSTSKAARDNAFAINDQIGIFVVPYAAMSPTETRGTLYGSGNYADNVPFVTINGTTFAPVTGNTIAYPNAQTKVDVYAFGLFNARYQDLGNDPKSFAWTVDAVQDTDAAILHNDLMSAAALAIPPSDAAIPLTFKHRLAKVDATVNIPSTFRGQNVTASTLFIDGTRLKATVDMTAPNQPVIVPSTNNNLTAIQAFNLTGAAYGTACTFQAIVLPGTVAAGALLAHLELTLADGSKATLECISAGAISYETGKQTKIAFTLENESTLNLGTIAITGWGAGDNHSVVARRPARLIFGTAGSAAKAALITTADLVIDDTTYQNVRVAFDATAETLTCTYLQPTTRSNGYIKAVTFKQANSSTVPATFDPFFDINNPRQIPQDPSNTDPNYKKQTATATL